jgi:putative transposase
MSRYRLYPTPAQEDVLLGHCAHARYVWNLAVEQRAWWQPGRRTPGYAELCRQLSEARAAFPWLADGSVIVQQQALRDFHAAYASWFAALRQWRKRYARIPPEERPAAPSPPSWRKRDVNEGFRIVATGPQNVWRLNRRWAQVLVPKLGWVRFQLSRPVPDAKSYRVTRDWAGRWHLAFADIPAPIPGPSTGEVVGIDMGVTVTLALSDGHTYLAPAGRDVKQLQHRMARAKRGSSRRAKLKARLGRLHAHNADARRDWAEKASTEVARGYDLIRVEDLDVRNMTRSARGTVARPGRHVGQKASLNGSILRSGWGMFATRLAHKARGRVEKVNPAYTSQRCSRCGTVDREARERQAAFRCRSCGYRANADHNAARKIAAGHAARGGWRWRGRRTANLNSWPARSSSWNPRPSGGEDVKVGCCRACVGGGARAW